MASPGQRDEIRSALERVLASPYFAASRRRSELLRYLMDRALAGQAESVTEYGIALDVFGKPPSFDPQRESTVRAEMSRLRRSLAEYYENGGARDPWRFQCSTRGYTLIAMPNPPEPEAAPAATPDSPPRKGRWRRVAAAIPLSALVLWALWGIWQIQRPAAVRSLVVLPFANLTGDSGSDYVADGLTEDLTDSLAHIAGLRVVARTSAFQFKGKAEDIREIGRRLDAEAVVEGSIQRSNGRWRITVQVNRSADGYHILSRRFEGEPAELARMEHDMAMQTVAAVRPGGATAASRNPDPEAYDLLLRARMYRGYGSHEAFEKELSLLREAIQRDPEYADAYAALAGAYASGAANGNSPPLESVAKGKAAAARALELDPASALAYAAEGFMDATFLLDWKRGEEELATAVRLMPQNIRSHNWLGVVLLYQGNFAAALAELKIADDLDPLVPAATTGVAYFMARQYDKALQHALHLEQMHPDVLQLHELLAEAWEGKGDYTKALAEYRALAPTDPDGAAAYIAHVYAVTGRAAEGRALAADLERKDADPLSIAIVYGALGDLDRAFQWVSRAWERRAISQLKVHPWLDPLRADPRYQVWLKRAGFVPR